MFGEVLGHTLGAGFHPFITRLPSGGAHFTVFIGEEHRIDHAEHFVFVASQRQVVDHGVTNGTVFVDQERSAQGNRIVEEDIIVAGDLLVEVGNQREVDPADAAVIDRGFTPGVVAVLRVDRAADDIDPALLEVFEAMREGNDLRGADESKVKRIENRTAPFSPRLS